MPLTTSRPRTLHLLWPALLLGTLVSCSGGTAQIQQTEDVQAQLAAPAQSGFAIKRGVKVTGQFQ